MGRLSPGDLIGWSFYRERQAGGCGSVSESAVSQALSGSCWVEDRFRVAVTQEEARRGLGPAEMSSAYARIAPSLEV